MEPQQVAIDISTGHAMDSLFRTGIRDPWATNALRLFVDLAVNHPQLAFPYPSAAALTTDADKDLPNVFVLGRKKEWGLINGLKSMPADSIALGEKLIKPQFHNFAKWLKTNPRDLQLLKNWVAMHFRTPIITEAHSKTVPIHQVAEFVSKRSMNNLAMQLGILSPQEIEYAFDVFVRGIQYNIVCGDATPYFPHPIRNRLTLPKATIDFEGQSAWSWGGCVAALLEEDSRYCNIARILEVVQSIKERSLKDATWYHLAKLPDDEQLTAVEAVASEAGLPGKLKIQWQKKIENTAKVLALSAPAATALAGGPNTLLGASVGILINSCALEISDISKRRLPLASRVKVLAGRVIEWPGLGKGAR